MSDENHGLRFIVLGANTPWVYALTEALAQRHPATAIRVYDWRTHRRTKVRWPAGAAPRGLARELWLYPPGYLGMFRPLFSRLMARRLRSVLMPLAGSPPDRTWLIAPYPWLAPPEIPVNWANLIYYNLDDYAIYRPERADLAQAQEGRTIRQSRLVICLARQQMLGFQSRGIVRPECIRHFPLGVCQELISPMSGIEVKTNTVGYVGTLGDRVDWQLVCAVAQAMPEVRFVFMGDPNDIAGVGNRADWAQRREAAFKLANVTQLPMVAQDQVNQIYWSSSINWIPYDAKHPFNIAACPTKIMDGLASGRPLLSSRVPECLLYPEWLPTFEDAAEAQALIGKFLAKVADGTWLPEAARQVQFTRRHLWSERAATLVGWITALDAHDFTDGQASNEATVEGKAISTHNQTLR